jgi:hypothetical protein
MLSDNDRFCPGCGQPQTAQQSGGLEQTYVQGQERFAYGVSPAPPKAHRFRLWLILAIALAGAAGLCVGMYFAFFAGEPVQTAGVPPRHTPKATSAAPTAQLLPPVVIDHADPNQDSPPAALYEGDELIAFLQGEWVSKEDMHGFHFGMLFHDNMYAATMASPKRADATLSHWRHDDYWDTDRWDWCAFSAQGNVIMIENNGRSEIGFWVYVHENDKIWFAYSDISDPDWEQADYIEVKRVRTKDQFDMATYLEGRWVSSIPYDEEEHAYVSLHFSGGKCVLSVARNVSGDPDVTKGQMEGWDFKEFATYDYNYTHDGFIINIEGHGEKYQVSIDGFALAHITHVESNETIFYYRDRSFITKEHTEQALNPVVGKWHHEGRIIQLNADFTATLSSGDKTIYGTYTFDDATQKGVLTLVAADTARDFNISMDAGTLFLEDVSFAPYVD